MHYIAILLQTKEWCKMVFTKAGWMLDSSSAQQCIGFAEKKAKVGGEFVRPDSKLRGVITADGSSGLPAQAGRYHLYIANNCPW